MSDAAAPAPVKAAPKKKTASKPKAAPTHPSYKEMVAAAIAALKERSGSSRLAIVKYILANYKVGDDQSAVNTRVKVGIKNALKAGTIQQSKGVGAAGSFRLDKTKVEKTKKKPVAKKPAAKKSPKKVAKKPAAKKTAAKKPAAKKSPAKKAAPKKPAAKKPAAKKTPAKKAPAKKAAAKKPAKK